MLVLTGPHKSLWPPAKPRRSNCKTWSWSAQQWTDTAAPTETTSKQTDRETPRRYDDTGSSSNCNRFCSIVFRTGFLQSYYRAHKGLCLDKTNWLNLWKTNGACNHDTNAGGCRNTVQWMGKTLPRAKVKPKQRATLTKKNISILYFQTLQ